MTTTRQKISLGLMFFGIALGAAAFMAFQTKPQGESHAVYYDNAGVKHPDGDLRGAVERKTAVWMLVAAAAVFLAGVSVRER